jgi:hypothetical protein
MIYGITEILSSLLKIGVTLSEKQTELLKWRLSPAAQKYYDQKENSEFYNALIKGDIKVVDAIRKEKQKRINDLKNSLLSILLVVSCSLITACSTTPAIDTKIIEQKWDTKSLTDKDRTYKIESEKPIKIEEEKEPVSFKGDWFVVNQDMLKTYNENQDSLLTVLNKNKEMKDEFEKKYKIITYIAGGLVLLILIQFVLYKRIK